MKSIIMHAAMITMSEMDSAVIVEAGAHRSLSRLVSKFDKPFAILSGFREHFTLRENKSRNSRLKEEIRGMIKKASGSDVGPILLRGQYMYQSDIDSSSIPKDMTIQDAISKGLISQDDVSVEDSYFVEKPEDMDIEDFNKVIISLGKKFDQESVLLSDGDNVHLRFMDGSRLGLGRSIKFNQPRFVQSMLKKRRGQDAPYKKSVKKKDGSEGKPMDMNVPKSKPTAVPRSPGVSFTFEDD